MKKFSILFLTLGLSTTLLSGQTTLDVPSYTNADLDPNGTAATHPSAIPGLSNHEAAAVTTGTGPSATSNTAPTVAAKKYPPLTPEQQKEFAAQMQQQIQNAENQVQGAMNQVTNQTLMPNDFDRMIGEQSITNLQVKKTIYEKFVNSPSIRSPKVQAVLLKVLSNNDIQPGDLAELQSVVNDERPYTYP